MWWIDLLLLAQYEDKQIFINGKSRVLKRGQLKASLLTLMDRWECRKHAVIEYLRFLEDEKMIEREKLSNVTIITIINYEKYQQAEQKRERKSSIKGSAISDTTNGTTNGTSSGTTNGTVTNKVKESKEGKEVVDNITPHTNNACARIEKDEEAYYTEAKSSGEFLEHLQRKFRIFDVTRFSNLIDEYHKECKGLDIRHTSHKDFRQKFEWWAADKVQGVFPTEQVVNNLIEADGKQTGWQLIEHYKSYFELVRKANLTNYIYKLDILRPWQYDDLVMVRGFTPQEIWDSTLELDNNEQYCRNHKNAYSCLITFCDYNKRRR